MFDLNYVTSDDDSEDDCEPAAPPDAESVAPAFSCSAPSCSRSATRLTRALSSKTCGGRGGV